MATAEDVARWEQEHGKANDTPIDIVNDKGEVIGTAEYGPGTKEALDTGAPFYQQADGSFSPTPYSGVSFDSNTGKIDVTVPEIYKDDEKINAMINDNILSQLSVNYQADKNVTYPDPYNEENKIDTAKFVEYLNSGIQDRVNALNAVPYAQSWLISQYGNSQEAVDSIKNLTADDMVTMFANGSEEGSNDDSPVSVPHYIQDAFPKIKELESWSNGFAKKSDILNNWYNVSNGSLSRDDALAIEKYFAEEALQNNIQNMSPDEIARTVAFSKFLAKNDPTMSSWDAFWTNFGESVTGFNEGLYGNVATAIDSMVNLVTTPIRRVMAITTGQTHLPVKEFLWSDHKVAAPNFSQQMLEDRYINSGGAQALAIGKTVGQTAYTLADIALTNAAFSAIGAEVTSNIASKGAEKVALTMAEEADAATAMKDSGAIAQIGAKAGVSAKGAPQTTAELYRATSDALRGDTALFGTITNNAERIATKVLGVTEIQLQSMSVPQMTTVVKSALDVVKNARLANTALGVMSTFTIAATVNNSDLTNKIIRNTAAPEEVRTWVKQMAWDTAVLEAVGAVGKVGTGQIGKSIRGTKVEKAVNVFRDKVSKATEKFTDTVTNPYVKFRQWAIDRKMESQAMSKAGIKNSTLANKQAATEAEVRREFRGWMQTQSTQSAPGATTTAQALGTVSTDTLGGAASAMKGITSALGTTVYDPVTETSGEISPFAAAKAGEVRLRNIQTDLGDIQTLETQLISQFSDPDIEPVISDRMSEAANADTNLINMEAKAGLLPKDTLKTDRKIIKQAKKQPYNALYAGHSPEVVRFAVRSQELTIARNEALNAGLELSPDTPGYGDALKRYNKAAEALTPEIIDQINNYVLPAYRKLEYEITNYAIDPNHAVFSRSLINGLRSKAKWGEEGKDWIRLAAAKEMPNGVYVPKDRFTQNTTVADMKRDKILEDDELTWIGNGLNAMIREIAVSEAYKRMATAVKQADGLVIGTVKSGEETQAASNVKEYEKDFHSAVKDGIKSFTEDMSRVNVVSKLNGKKPIVSADGEVEIKGELPQGESPKLLERGPIILAADIEHARASGVMVMDGESVRNVMADNKIPTSNMIVDQESFSNYYLQSSDAAKKVLASNFSDEVVADYRAFLNSLVPGFDVLEWSLLGREHTNGLFPGGMYADIKSPVRAYIMDIDDLRMLIGSKDTESRSASAIDKVKRHINLNGKNGILPLHYDPTSSDIFRLELRWYNNRIHYTDWEDYLNGLEAEGITRVPVAVTADAGSMGSELALSQFLDTLDETIATGEKPKFDEKMIAMVMEIPGWGSDKIYKRIRSAAPPEVMSSEEIDELITKAEQFMESVHAGLKGYPETTSDELVKALDKAVRNRVGIRVLSKGTPDITATNLPGLIRQYGLDKVKDIVSKRGQDPELVEKWLRESTVKDITEELTQAQADYGYIPWFHSQHAPLGSAEFNAEPPAGESAYTAQGGVGDALWVAPNSSYTKDGGYGDNQTIANIPRKYFMTDKEMKSTVKDLSSELNALREKAIVKGSKEWQKVANSIEDKAPTDVLETVEDGLYAEESAARKLGLRVVGTSAEDNFSPIYVNKDNLMYRSSHKIEKTDISEENPLGILSVKFSFTPKGKIWKSPGLENEFLEKGKKLLSKKDKATYDKLGKIVNHAGGVASYRALAEYTGKPIIDTTKDMNKRGIEGTAFFYYKDVSPEFDKELGDQLEAQAKVTNQESWDDKAVSDAMAEYEGMPLDELLDNMFVGSVPEDWIDSVSGYMDGTVGKKELDNAFHDLMLTGVGTRQWGSTTLATKAWKEAMESSAPLDPHNIKIHWDGVNDKFIQKFLGEMGEKPPISTPQPTSGEKAAWAAIDPTNPANVPDSNFTKRNIVDFNKLTEMRRSNYSNAQEILDEADKLNAYDKIPEDNKTVLEAGEKANKEAQEFWKENIYDLDFSYEVKPEPTAEKKPKAKRGDNLKYKLDENQMLEDVDNAIDGMIELVANDLKSTLYIRGANLMSGYQNSDTRTVFYVLSDVLSKDNKNILDQKIKKIAKQIVDSAIPPKAAVIKGNLESLYRKAEKLMKDRMISKLADAKNTLESIGEEAKSDTIKSLLKDYDEEIMGYKSKDTYIQTTDVNGNYEWLEVTPAVGELYNKRPLYKPMGTIQETLANMALLKRISLTNLSPRSFAKQAVSDPALSFVTTGSLPIPGMYTQTSQAIAAQFGERIAADMAKYDPRRYANVQEIASRRGISIAEAAVKNMDAMAATQAPFTTMTQEVTRQADINRYGTKKGLKANRKTINDRVNSGLRKATEILGTPNDKRELWNRQLAEVKQRYNMLERGYNYAQAEEFGRHALDNSTTNFRQKHTIFNALRTTVPYLTAGLSGAKSFWQMFELDPIGVMTRIYTGFVVPIMWLMGEIMDDDDLRQQYEDLAEYEKEDHLIIAAGGKLIRIPVGEELGGIINPIMHTVETIHGENQYDFWLLMLNDAVGFLPTDFTGFTEPDMWQNISQEAPSFMEVMDNGISTLLASTMPPVFQSAYMAISGRDLYTGKKIDSNRITIDNNGDAVIQGWSQSEFSKAAANVVGGDPRVVEKVTSGILGTTMLHVLDSVTSAVQWIGTQGNEGSLTTAIEKTAGDLANPYTVHGYNSRERQWKNSINELFRKKEEIVSSKQYREYNSAISQETDQKVRQNKINGRNGLLTDFQNEVEKLVKGYQNQGGQLDGLRFSQIASLLTFEDAVRADRTFMHLNTEYGNARKLALRTLYDMGITNPEGPSMFGYIYFDKNGEEQVKLWTPAQMQIIQDTYYQQGNIYQAHIKAIVEGDSENSVKKLKKAEEAAEKPYWDKYNATGKLTNDEWNQIDELRKAYDAQVVVALRDYIDSYGARQVLSNETVLDYLEGIIKVPSSYETIKGRNISSEGGKLNKQKGFAPSYIKTIFGVK